MKPLVDKKIKLEKYPGKGGWTYARIPDAFGESTMPFRWRKVKGTIDGYVINRYHLMPMGEGQLFLPVKAEIRKQIGKQAGDTVHVILYPDTDPLEIPGELMLCLEDEPTAMKFFNTLSDSEKKYYIQWIYAAKREETKTNRMANAINKLSSGLRFYEPE
jgi:hypothetical protein